MCVAQLAPVMAVALAITPVLQRPAEPPEDLPVLVMKSKKRNLPMC